MSNPNQPITGALANLEGAVLSILKQAAGGSWGKLSADDQRIIEGATAHRASLLVRRLQGLDDATYTEGLAMDRAAFASIASEHATLALQEWHAAFLAALQQVLGAALAIVPSL